LVVLTLLPLFLAPFETNSHSEASPLRDRCPWASIGRKLGKLEEMLEENGAKISADVDFLSSSLRARGLGGGGGVGFIFFFFFFLFFSFDFGKVE